MSDEKLIAMKPEQAAQALEKASKSDFEGAGGLGSQLIEMRDKDPQAYSNIMKQATRLADNDTGDSKNNALHNFALVDDLDKVQQSIRTGNIQELQTMLHKLGQDSSGSDDAHFSRSALEKGAKDAGYIARPKIDGEGNAGMILHKPGSPYGLDLSAKGAIAYDWSTKKDLPAASARQILATWGADGPPSDKDLRSETGDSMRSLERQDSLTQAMSPTINEIRDTMAIAYTHGYDGLKGLAASQALARDVGKDTGVTLDLTRDPQYPTDARVEITFKDKGSMHSGWQFE